MAKRDKEELQSTISIYTHLNDTEALRREMEKSLEIGLKLIGELNDETDPSIKSELVSLLKRFQTAFKGLHGLYVNLIVDLKKLACNNGKSNGTASNSLSAYSYSYSDSEIPSKKHDELKETRGGIAELQNWIDAYHTLQKQLENFKDRNFELENEVHSIADRLAQRNMEIRRKETELDSVTENAQIMQYENERLKTEVETLCKQVAEMKEEKTVEEIKLELKVETLIADNKSKKQILEDAAQQFANLSMKLRIANEENGAFKAENSALAGKTQVAESSLVNLGAESEVGLKFATEGFSSDSAKLLAENRGLEVELKPADCPEKAWKRILPDADKESWTLKTQILKLSSQIQEAEKTFRDLTAASRFFKDENTILPNSNNDLEEQLKVKDDEYTAILSETSKKAREAQEMIEKLKGEKDYFKSECSPWLGICEKLKLELEAGKREVSEVKRISEEDEAKNDILTAENQALLENIELVNSQFQIAIDALLFDLLEAHMESADLKHLLGASVDKNKVLSFKMLTHRDQDLQEVLLKAELPSEIGKLREKECIVQQSQIEIVEHEKVINDLKAENERLRAVASLVATEVSDLNRQLKSAITQMTDLSLTLEAKEAEKGLLSSELLTVTAQLQKTEVHVKKLETELQQLREINLIPDDSKPDLEKRLEVSALWKELKEIREESSGLIQAMKTHASDFQNGLERVQSLELHLKQSYQKLMTEIREKEEKCKRMVEALREENKELYRRTDAFRPEAIKMKNKLRHIKDVGSAEMAALRRAHHKLEVEFEEKCRHINKCLNELAEEVFMFETYSAALVEKKIGVNHEMCELQLRVNDKEGNNTVLKDEVASIEKKLAKKKQQNEERMELLAAYELLHIQPPEKRLEDMEVKALIEKNKVAITQLFRMMEYHQENCNHPQDTSH